MKKKYLLLSLALVLVILIAIPIFKTYLQESQIDKYLSWIDKTYQSGIIDKEQSEVIAYVNDTPIYNKDLIMYAMLKSIDTNYFQKLDLNESLESAEVLQSSFQDVLNDTIYCLWADKAGLNYKHESVQEWFNRVLEIQAKSKTPNVAAKARVQIQYREDYEHRLDGLCADKLIEEKYYPDFTDDPVEIGQYMLEQFRGEASKYNIILLPTASDYLKTDEFFSKLKEFNMNLNPASSS